MLRFVSVGLWLAGQALACAGLACIGASRRCENVNDTDIASTALTLGAIEKINRV